MVIAPFPHRYGVGSSDLTAEPRRSIAVGAPPQFGGSVRARL
jgi:hypothetical protein